MTAPNNVPSPPSPVVPPNGWQPYQQDNKQGKKPFYKRWWFWLIVVLVVLGAAGAVGGNESGSTSTSASTKSNTSQTAAPSKPSESAKPATPATPAEKTIELQATATGNGTVLISKNGSTDSQQFSGSWSKTYTGDEAKGLTSIFVSGDITGGNDQQVTCKVIVNGQEKDSKSASGTVGSARCDVPWF